MFAGVVWFLSGFWSLVECVGCLLRAPASTTRSVSSLQAPGEGWKAVKRSVKIALDCAEIFQCL